MSDLSVARWWSAPPTSDEASAIVAFGAFALLDTGLRTDPDLIGPHTPIGPTFGLARTAAELGLPAGSGVRRRGLACVPRNSACLEVLAG